MAKPMLNVEQISTVMNQAVSQYIGETLVLETDLSNIVDFGTAYDKLPSNTRQMIQSDLVSLVTEQIFVIDEFMGDDVNIIKSFATAGGNGGIIQKTRMRPAEFEDDPSYDPAPGSTNDPFKNYALEMETIYFANKIAEMVSISIPKNWFVGMFLSADKMNSAIAMIESTVRNAVKIHINLITKETINARIAANLHKKNPQQAINLLERFNAKFGTTLTADKALTDPEFGRFAVYEMETAVDILGDYNGLSNIMGYPNSTPKESMHFLINSQFVNAIHKYLYSDTYQVEYVKLPNYRKVFKWQGTGADGAFGSTSAIDVEVKVPWEEETVKVKQSGIVGVAYHPDAVGIYDLNETTESMRDPIGLKTNYFTHLSGSTMVDPYEDFVVFYIADV